MGSPLVPALANNFMSTFENRWLQNCPNDSKSGFYKQCVDDIFHTERK